MSQGKQSPPALCSRLDSSPVVCFSSKAIFSEKKKKEGEQTLYKSILSPVKSMLCLRGIEGKKAKVKFIKQTRSCLTLSPGRTFFLVSSPLAGTNIVSYRSAPVHAASADLGSCQSPSSACNLTRTYHMPWGAEGWIIVPGWSHGGNQPNKWNPGEGESSACKRERDPELVGQLELQELGRGRGQCGLEMGKSGPFFLGFIK